MSFQRPVRHHNEISKTMADVAKKALAQLSQIPAAKVADAGGDIKSGLITMEKAAKLYPGMHEVGFGLYRIATDDETLPTIWKREVFTDKDTGAKVEWLVAYTTDDEDIMREVASSIKKTSEAPPAGGGGGGEPPKKNQTPIAPGVLNKNLNLDQSGQGGTAKVTVEFNDLEKGQQFYEGVEENAGGAAKAPAAPGAPEEEPKKEEEAPEEEPKGPPAPQTPPVPTPAGGPGMGAPPPPMASTIKTLTVYGQQMVTVKAEKFANYTTQYYYINEIGERVDLPFAPVFGSKFNRPDQPGTMIRVMGIETEAAQSDDDEIIKALAVDVSDQVPPMNWTNKESQNEQGEGTNQGGPLPPNPALQPGQPPTADTTQKPLYDSNQDTGTKPKYNISVNPEAGSVTVKLEKPEAIDAIEQAVQGPQSPMPPAQQPAAQQQPGAQPPAAMAGQPKNNLNDTESPVQF